MEIVTGDRYLESLVNFVQKNTSGLIEGTLVLKLNPVGLHYVQSRLDALSELEALIAGAPVDYLRAYVSDLGDHRALEQLRRILCRLTSLKIVSVLQFPSRDPTPLSLVAFGRLKVLELRGCDLSTSAAKGLLELRHTLEKLICHNSTDALRHVFASRIADIKESSQWNRLSFVSCACNGLILMDESLQLLAAVETLDLSRNKFAKVDNLRKCTRLTHLDLGFNQLRSIASFSEVTCHIRKLVLRNNALTTLRGIENLKCIEELDVSYNVISNYVELEVFSSLSPLKNIWLEGNPLCCTRWYRPQVLSFFLFPEEVKLDDKAMSTREFWKRQIIIARRHRRPASYGFYCPAREEREVERFINGKRKKFSRLACIESDDSGMNIEPDLLSCNNDVQSGEEDVSDNEGELSSLLNRIEFMKKERSKLWLEEFKDWMDQGYENWVDENRNSLAFGNSLSGDTSNWRNNGDYSRYFEYLSDSIIHSEDDSSKSALEPNSSVASSVGNHSCQWLLSAAENGEKKSKVITRALDIDCSKIFMPKGKDYLRAVEFNPATSGSNVQDGDEVNASLSTAPLITSNSIKRLTSLSGPPLSPPHYEEDILYRRHSLEEEILQVSAESFSAASSDSYTSSDEDHRHESGPPSPKTGLYVYEEVFAPDVNWKATPHLSKDDNGLKVPEVGRGWDSQHSCVQQPTREFGGLDNSLEVPLHSEPLIGNNNEKISTSNKQDRDYYEIKYSKRKPKKRVISLSDSTSFSGVDVEEGKQKQIVNFIGSPCGNVRTAPDEAVQVQAYSNHAVSEADDHIESYFNSLFADSTIHETCKQFIVCNCLFGKEPLWSERKVAVVLSSESKLYVILLHGMIDGSGNSLSLMTSHKAEDVSEVLAGLGLLCIRVYINDDISYMLITRCEEKTRHLLSMLGLTSPDDLNNCSIRSLDQVQLNLFYRHIAGSLGISIHQYCMVLFQQGKNGEEEWLPRSLVVDEGRLIVCIENFCHFRSLTVNEDAASYFMLDSCHSIADVSEMVIEAKDYQCVTLTFREDSRVSCFSSIVETMKLKVGLQNKSTVRAQSWKLKWFSGESLCKFVTLVNAIHRGLTTSTLSIVYKS